MRTTTQKKRHQCPHLTEIRARRNKDASVVSWTEPSLTFLHHSIYRGPAVEKWKRPANRWEDVDSSRWEGSTAIFISSLHEALRAAHSALNFTMFDHMLVHVYLPFVSFVGEALWLTFPLLLEELELFTNV